MDPDRLEARARLLGAGLRFDLFIFSQQMSRAARTVQRFGEAVWNCMKEAGVKRVYQAVGRRNIPCEHFDVCEHTARVSVGLSIDDEPTYLCIGCYNKRADPHEPQVGLILESLDPITLELE